jgi:tripartite-type tricarboxylate transporter receptor subunit TctC
LVASLTGIAATGAQDYPARTVTLLVGFAPGGIADIYARLFANGATQKWGKPVVVENRVGAGTQIATAAAANAEPDGTMLSFSTTMTMAANNFLTNPASRPYKSEDIAPISTVVAGSFILVVAGDSPYKTVDDLLKDLRANPDKLNAGTIGNLTSGHLVTEYFRKSAGGLKFTNVHYRGSGPAQTGLLRNDVQFLFDGTTTLVPQVQAGTLRALASTGSKREPAFPGTPTLQELGFKDFVSEVSYTIWGSSKTPEPIKQKIASTVKEVFDTPEFKERAARDALGFVMSTTKEAEALYAADNRKWGALIKEMDIKAE